MIERYAPVPITEPNIPVPIFEPQVYPLEEIFFAFTTKQREAIRNRDNNTCQARGIIPHKCKPEKLHVHHLIPQRYSKELKPPIDPDYPENALTICESAHRTIHPDMDDAIKTYRQNPESFQNMGKLREDLLKKKITYWDSTWDRQLITRAAQNTQRAKRDGWEFPQSKSKLH